MTFAPWQSIDYDRYPDCHPTIYSARSIIEPEVHEAFDALMRRLPDAPGAHEFAALYERVMGVAANTRLMLDTLAACGIHIVA